MGIKDVPLPLFQLDQRPGQSGVLKVQRGTDLLGVVFLRRDLREGVSIIGGTLAVPDPPAVMQDRTFLAMYGNHQILGEPVLYHICLVFAIVPKSHGDFLRLV